MKISRLDVTVLGLMNDNGWDSCTKSVSVKQLTALLEDCKYKSVTTVLRHVKKLVQDGYIVEGLCDGYASMYYITELGKELVSSVGMQKLKSDIVVQESKHILEPAKNTKDCYASEKVFECNLELCAQYYTCKTCYRAKNNQQLYDTEFAGNTHLLDLDDLNEPKTVECIGYIIKAYEQTVTVALPEKPFGKFKMKLPQNEKVILDGFYDTHELKVFNITVDEDNKVVKWSFGKLENCVEIRYFVALLADKRILADDGKTYKLFESPVVNGEDWASQFDYMFSAGRFSTVRNIRLYIKNGIIYATDELDAYKLRDSWAIEDVMAKHLASYDRYYVVKNSED